MIKSRNIEITFENNICPAQISCTIAFTTSRNNGS